MSLLARLQPKAPQVMPSIETAAPAVQPPAIQPCPTCGCPLLWMDIYRAQQADPSTPWRCLHCDPPPAEALVASWRDVSRLDGQIAKPAAENAIDAAECTHTATWPAYVSEWRPDSGWLERWRVCRRCGMWIERF